MTAVLDLGADLVPREACGFGFPQRPHPKQRAFLLCGDDREVFTGGGGGGGKSSSALLAALQYVCVPGYSALLMRQTYPQLIGDDGLIARGEEWLGATAATWHASENVWEFPSGATIRFGHCERDADRFKFAGHALQYVAFDELPNWPTPKVYLYVGFARVRKPASAEGLAACPTCGLTLADVPLRTRATGNPVGPGLQWVRSRFGIQLPGGCPDGRRAIMSLLTDNLSLDTESYAAGLAELDPIERARMLDGNWEISEAGRMFRREFFLQ